MKGRGNIQGEGKENGSEDCVGGLLRAVGSRKEGLGEGKLFFFQVKCQCAVGCYLPNPSHSPIKFKNNILNVLGFLERSEGVVF